MSAAMASDSVGSCDGSMASDLVGSNLLAGMILFGHFFSRVEILVASICINRSHDLLQ